jgi:hypothetical protein
VRPFILPEGDSFDHDSGIEEYIEGNIGHPQSGIDSEAWPAMQENGHVGITVWAMFPSRPTAEQKYVCQIKLACHPVHELP